MTTWLKYNSIPLNPSLIFREFIGDLQPVDSSSHRTRQSWSAAGRNSAIIRKPQNFHSKLVRGAVSSSESIKTRHGSHYSLLPSLSHSRPGYIWKCFEMRPPDSTGQIPQDVLKCTLNIFWKSTKIQDSRKILKMTISEKPTHLNVHTCCLYLYFGVEKHHLCQSVCNS